MQLAVVLAKRGDRRQEPDILQHLNRTSRLISIVPVELALDNV
jgi:hypothetical protein